MMEPIAYVVSGLFAMGMAVSFLAADPRAPTSLALSLMWFLLGLAVLLNIPAYAVQGNDLSPVWLWSRVYSVLDSAVMVCAFEWLLRVGRTEVTCDPTARSGEWILRAAQLFAVAYGLPGLLRPALRDQAWAGAWQLESFTWSGFALFAVPLILALSLAGFRMFQLLRAKLDPAERVRFVALFLASPFLLSATFLPPRWKPLGSALGALIFLIGAVQYHVLQGQRGQFLARFLSPQLARLVQERGLSSVMQRRRVELSVVVCDLRGFTAFTERAAPEEVMQLLEDFHGIIGEVVTEGGGSVQDFAGDGLLALVGAPIAHHDHAARAVAIALTTREQTRDVLAHWNRLGFGIGLGIGVTTGFATVGTIGGKGRLEYAAVGPAVNLAARLCARAEAGQILVDQRVVGSVGDNRRDYRFEQLETAELKGFARPVTIYAVESNDSVESQSV